jgi:hypothetical protein
MNLLPYKLPYEETHFICLVLDAVQWLQKCFLKYVGVFLRCIYLSVLCFLSRYKISVSWAEGLHLEEELLRGNPLCDKYVRKDGICLLAVGLNRWQ